MKPKVGYWQKSVGLHQHLRRVLRTRSSMKEITGTGAVFRLGCPLFTQSKKKTGAEFSSCPGFKGNMKQRPCRRKSEGVTHRSAVGSRIAQHRCIVPGIACAGQQLLEVILVC